MFETNTKASGFTYQHIPDRMKAIPQWLLFRLEYVYKEKKGIWKWDKIPTQINGYGASVTNPSHFSRFEDALFAYQMGVGDGLGFVFTDQDGLVFVDLDGAIENGVWKPEHLEIVQAFNTWGEISQSGTGAHLICEGTLDRAEVDHKRGMELYSVGRFVAMTGWSLQGWPSTTSNQQASIDWLAAKIAAAKGTSDTKAEYSRDPKPEMTEPVSLAGLRISSDIYNFLTQGAADKWGGDQSNALLAASMSLYRCGLTDGEVLGTLWHYCGHIAQQHRPVGDAAEWLWRYNVSPGRAASPPSPDSLFTQVPTTQVDRLQQIMSEVANLECGSVTDTATIHQARTLLAQSLHLDAGSRIAVHDAIRKAMTWTKSDTTAVVKELQREARKQSLEGHGGIDKLTDGYLYVAGLHSFLHKESGELLRPEAFVALHTHMSDEIREIVLSGDGVSKVTGLDFDPGQPEFFSRHGASYYNTWRGLSSFGAYGDITPWWNHLCLLVPEEREREHLLDWMAFTLQQPHRKINHCIVFGGHFGIGKDTLFWPLSRALDRHSKQVGAEALTRDFNEYLGEAKLVTFQEIEMGTHRDAKLIDNKLKPMIAAPPDTLFINPKGSTAYHIQNVVHLILFTNGDHPVVIMEGDRRYFVLSSELRVHDPITGEQRQEWRDYFAQLWSWMDAGNGWQAVLYYLLTRDVSRFNPKGAPPMTEGKASIIEQSRSDLETLMLDAIQGRAGPFFRSVTTAEQVATWLSTEGLGLLRTYGIKEPPTAVAAGRAMKQVGCATKRLRLGEFGQQRLWICRDQLGWLQASHAQLKIELEREPG